MQGPRPQNGKAGGGGGGGGGGRLPVAAALSGLGALGREDNAAVHVDEGHD